MSLKTLNKWLIFIAVLFGVFFGVWVSLEFILTFEEMQKYTIIFKFWRGVQRGSVFICALLAFVWFVAFIYSFIVAVRDVEPTRRQRPKKANKTPKRSKTSSRRPSRTRNHAANPRSPVMLDIEEDDD